MHFISHLLTPSGFRHDLLHGQLPQVQGHGPVSLTRCYLTTQLSHLSTSSTLSDTRTLFSQLSIDLDTHTIVILNLILKYEINFYYHGVSGDPPKLLWHSDVETNPFPVPSPGTNFFKIPTKAAHGVFKTPLNAV